MFWRRCPQIILEIAVWSGGEWVVLSGAYPCTAAQTQRGGTRRPYGDGSKNGQKFPNYFASSPFSVFDCSASFQQTTKNALSTPELPKCISSSSWQTSRQDLTTACSAVTHSYWSLPERVGVKGSKTANLDKLLNLLQNFGIEIARSFCLYSVRGEAHLSRRAWELALLLQHFLAIKYNQITRKTTRFLPIWYASPVKPELNGKVGLIRPAGQCFVHPVSGSSWTPGTDSGFRRIQKFSKCLLKGGPGCFAGRKLGSWLHKGISSIWEDGFRATGAWWLELTTEQTECRFIRHPFPRRNRKTADPVRSILPGCCSWSICVRRTADRPLLSTAYIFFIRKKPSALAGLTLYSSHTSCSQRLRCWPGPALPCQTLATSCSFKTQFVLTLLFRPFCVAVCGDWHMAGGTSCRFRGWLVVGSVLRRENSDAAGKHYFLGSFLYFSRQNAFWSCYDSKQKSPEKIVVVKTN